MNALFSAFLVLITFSCTYSYTPELPGPALSHIEKKVLAVKKSTSSYSDTLVVIAPAAVFFQPDSLQLSKIKSQSTNVEFESQKHNCFYLAQNARNVLKEYWPKIRRVEPAQVRYLLFVKENKDKVLLDLNSQGDLCGILLFDGKKNPELADMMNINTALEFYLNH